MSRARERTRIPLRIKLAALLVAAAVAPLGVASCKASSVQRDALLRAEQELEAAVVDDVASYVSRALDDVERRGRVAAAILGDGRIADDALRVTLATDALADGELVSGARVFDATGALLLPLRGAAEPAWAIDGDVAGGEPRWASAKTAEAAGVSYRVQPIRAGERLTGRLVLRVDVRAAADTLGALAAARLGASDRITIVDRQLRIVVPSARAGEAAMGGSVEADIAQGAFGSVAFVRTLTYRGRDGAPMVGTIRSLPRVDVAAVVGRPEAEAFGALVAAKRALYTFAIAIGVLAIALGVWLARRVTRPIEALVELTKAFAARRFDETSKVRTGDEIDDLGHALEDMAQGLAAGEREIARRVEIETSLGRYLPREVVATIADGSEALSLEGKRRTIAVLFADVTGFTTFADVTGFTTFSERAAPEDVVALLGELFSLLAEVVFRHGGMLDKFVGDSLMAIFGATEQTDLEQRQSAALAAAEDMHRFVAASRPVWKEKYGFEVHLAIGIAGGEALVGNIGTPSRIEFTAIGDTVNVASRLEALARPDQTLVAGDVTADADDVGLRSLGAQPLRGRAHPVEIFEVVE
ncbi:MAG: adenylate/guanylate cyclase domain-containing protein [Deltaproteobacteria bacterium]|nr:adenylate/guanylate cyclase domain-containing protein [Deltaproteobacteria bacterium]